MFDNFFQGTVFPFFDKISCGHPLLKRYCIYIRYTMFWQIFLFKAYCNFKRAHAAMHLSGIHIHLGSSQTLGSLKKTVNSLIKETWVITPTSLLKKNLTYSSIFKVYFTKSFATAKVCLLFLKVACVVKTKFFFIDWFYYNLIILIKQCKIPYKNVDKALLFSRNQVFCLKIWNLWRAPTTLQFNIFCWNFAHILYLPMSTKGCVGFFYFV